MRVVDVTQWYSPVSGGIRTYLRAKAAWAAAHGRPHAAIVTGAGAREERVADSTFAQVPGRTPSRRWGYRVATRPASVIAALERLRPAVVVVHDALAFPRTVAEWAARRGVPVAMVCHSDLELGAAGLPRPVRAPVARALRAAQRRALVAPSAVIVASVATRERIAAHTTAPVLVSALGIDAAVFRHARPDPAVRCALASRGQTLLLYAGRVSSDKRVDLLPAALAALGPGHVLAVAGSGAGGRALARRARRLGVAGRIVHLGHVADRRRLATLMASADCFVHPNPTEPFGLCPLEALAAGCRVVAPASLGAADALRDGGGVLVAPDDPAALAEGVRRALRSPRPRADLATLSWERTFAREWDLYADLAAAA